MRRTTALRTPTMISSFLESQSLLATLELNLPFMDNCSLYQNVKSDHPTACWAEQSPRTCCFHCPSAEVAHSYLTKVLLLLLNSYLVLPSEDNVLGESNPTRVKWQPWQPGMAPTTSAIVSSGSHTVGSPFLSPVWSRTGTQVCKAPPNCVFAGTTTIITQLVCISNEAYSLVSSEGTTCLDPAPSY